MSDAIGRPKKYIINVGDVYDDYICIDIVKDEKNYTRYVMQCQKCGKIKYMLGPTVAQHKGTKHKSCGKGLGVTYDKAFYNKWQGMRARTSPKFWNHENYYDRGINSDAFDSFIDFYNAMYDSWLKHVEEYGEADTSLERIDVDGNYTPDNCCWICLSEQKGNQQKTLHFKVTDKQTGDVEYHKSALAYAKENDIPGSYIHELISKERTYRGKTYQRVSKQEYEDGI